MRFLPTPWAIEPGSLKEFKTLHGGAYGRLESGRDTLEVLRVRPNVYLSAGPVSPLWDILANGQQADIHPVSTPAEAFTINQRLRGYDHGA